MTIVKIEANVEWKFFRATGGNWVAVCDPLGLTVQSDTHANLMEDIALTLNAVLKDLLEERQLEQFLRDRGWRPVQGSLPTAPDDVYFDVPFAATRLMERDCQIAVH
jgi:predicted RNase H-like HicB family nuclease